jgi:GGDEF domain-containing protein
MRIQAFDHIDPADLERRQWHLWALALTVIVILAIGMGLLMYPAVFAHPVVLSGATLRQIFFGFCTLSTLLLGYLVDRQIVISNLRKRLEEEQKRVMDIRHEASVDLLGTLPGLDHFRDRLAMEFRRASHTRQPLSLLAINLKPSRQLADTAEVQTAFGDAVKALTRKLRGGDSIYLFAPGVFGVVLPGADLYNAYRVVDRLADGLQDASGACTRFAFDVQVFNYPEHAATARELEEAINAFLPSRRAGSPQTETMIVSPRTL